MGERHVVIVGAGPAGVSAAVALKDRGIRPIVVDQAESVASSWRRRYDRLRLNTCRPFSHLPKQQDLDDLTEYGLPVPDEGVFTRLRRTGQAPAIVDKEVIEAVKAGRIEVVGPWPRSTRPAWSLPAVHASSRTL
jgi:2-polyprenyl-6-methoxyphenol hydroxylase-like FAD-dependent oxidoreductase